MAQGSSESPNAAENGKGGGFWLQGAGWAASAYYQDQAAVTPKVLAS
jgi:hypothetical protein